MEGERGGWAGEVSAASIGGPKDEGAACSPCRALSSPVGQRCQQQWWCQLLWWCQLSPGSRGRICSNSMKAALGLARATRVCPVWLAPARFPKPQYGEAAVVGRHFLADTMTSYFLQALIFSCYLSFYKPVSMRTCRSEDGAGPSNVC